jgi:osmotically-inducible protein OsmY
MKVSKIIVIVILSQLLMGCMSNIFTGANLIYDRHNVYLKFDDVQLTSFANRALFRDNMYQCPTCMLELMVLNRDILLVGSVPTQALRMEASRRLLQLPNHGRIFNQLYINSPPPGAIQDSWITLSIRTYILSNANIDPHAFKVLTWSGVVYLMGNVMPEQADLVINYAKECTGVIRVVNFMRYYHLGEEKA